MGKSERCLDENSSTAKLTVKVLVTYVQHHTCIRTPMYNVIHTL